MATPTHLNARTLPLAAVLVLTLSCTEDVRLLRAPPADAAVDAGHRPPAKDAAVDAYVGDLGFDAGLRDADPLDAIVIVDATPRDAMTIDAAEDAGQRFDAGDAPPEIIFDNFNVSGVDEPPEAPTMFTIARPYLVTSIMTYHYNNAGALPGTLGLASTNGAVFGPWQSYGLPGQGGVANAHWVVEPFVEIPTGTYTVMDSGPETWARNEASGLRGFARIEGFPR